MKVRASRAYLEFVQIFRELKAVVKPAQDRKLVAIPIDDVKKVYLKMATYITEKPKREKRKIEEIERVVKFDKDSLPLVRKEIKTEVEDFKSFTKQFKAGKAKLDKQATQFSKKKEAQPSS
mmetsp:Transcript_12967/g.20086  ORF Transcript_12967/g.20086 Transcript_12967/m.20086 type:complete len:121 (+) Transcript_12967:602-964(+)